MKKCVAVSMESLKILCPEIITSTKPFTAVQIPDDVTIISHQKVLRKSFTLATGDGIHEMVRHTSASAAIRCAKSLDTNTFALENVLETTTLINESCNVALETLNDMLTFDKIDENKLVVELEDLNPWKFIQETAKPFKINATQVNVQLYIQCAEFDTKWFDSFHIKADKFKLSQVLRNLVSNALKFTPSGGEVKILIEKKRVADSSLSQQRMSTVLSTAQDVDCSVRFSVVDNGCGISKENQARMFGKYVQFNAGALQQGKGSGLGLWISKSE
jgi:signal transduction histidine kinase